ncbi:AraC family transcriptional regulator [Burkholderia lata]|uniref:GlxA family transcriptional regulator n=1 Tax=Burkholderia lata (strain ATCC 17760 / DSM 23089 / LMG 22485 / NCIMB 9086 / R18194 / 383) TaxID=482957 RepID=UPI0014530D33|nr:GlxA family transcriptional regulator [Burkholderia lata]VWB25476.1 AraC family transcriptional regulator [Burkholderia lata]
MSHAAPVASAPEPDTPARIRFGFVLLPNFTLTAFSGMVDVLRLAADEGDNSRPVRLSWTILGDMTSPVRASCGIQVPAWESLNARQEYDYVVVVGGLLHVRSEPDAATLEFIRAAASAGAMLVGICTGAFALARAGVMAGHRICISWFHYWDFIERFPSVDAKLVVSDRLYVLDGRRVTCSGGRASIDVAAAILVRHIEPSIVYKALRILLVDGRETVSAPQPHPPGVAPNAHPKVKRAILLMEQHISHSITIDELARRLDVSSRQLERLFREATGGGPAACYRAIRIRTAAWMLMHLDKNISEIAAACGFADASHLGREFRRAYGMSPSAYRERQAPGAIGGMAEPAERATTLGELFPNRNEFY